MDREKVNNLSLWEKLKFRLLGKKFIHIEGMSLVEGYYYNGYILITKVEYYGKDITKWERV